MTCPCLSHILRPPRRRLHLVVHHVLALRPREALLDNFLNNLLRSDPLPLSDCKKGDSSFQKKSSATPHNGKVLGSKSLVPLWRSATAYPTPGWLGGLWGGRLDSGGSAGWLSDPLRPSTSSIREASLPAGVLTSAHQGSRLNPRTSDPSSEGGSRTSPSVSGLLQPSLPRPEGFGVVAPHH